MIEEPHRELTDREMRLFSLGPGKGELLRRYVATLPERERHALRPQVRALWDALGVLARIRAASKTP